MSNILTNMAFATNSINMMIKDIEDHADQKKYIQKKTDSLGRATIVAGKMLDAYRKMSMRQQADEFSHLAKSCQLIPVVQELNHLLDHKVEKFNIRYNFQLQDYEVLCLESELMVVLFNLIKNAFDSVENLNGDQRWVEMKQEKNHENLKILIKNGGPKWQPNHLEDIFSAPASSKDKNGSGIGLKVVNKVSYSAGFKLKLDDTLEHTCVVLEIPVELLA